MWSIFYGGASALDSYQLFPPPDLIDFIAFFHTPLYFDGSFLHQKYVIEERSAVQIANEIFSSKSTVLKALKEQEIEIREPHKPHGNPAQVRFGKKKWGQRQVKKRTEMKVIGAIQDMYSIGTSLRQIASCLTKMGIPTKSGQAKWHPETIRRAVQTHKR